MCFVLHLQLAIDFLSLDVFVQAVVLGKGSEDVATICENVV
jgi:hypothetical protein